MSLGQIVVRRLAPEDFEGCVEIHRASERAGQVPPGYEGDFVAGLLNREIVTFCLLVDGRLAGCGSVVCYRALDRWGSSGYLGSLSYGLVHPEHQRRGYGRILLSARLAFLGEGEPVPNYFVLTATRSSEKYHSRNGFEPGREWEDRPGTWLRSMHLQASAEAFEAARTLLAERSVQFEPGFRSGRASVSPPLKMQMFHASTWWHWLSACEVVVKGDYGIEGTVWRRAYGMDVWHEGKVIASHHGRCFRRLREGKMVDEADRRIGTWRWDPEAPREKPGLRLFLRGLGRLETSFTAEEDGCRTLEVKKPDGTVLGRVTRESNSITRHVWSQVYLDHAILCGVLAAKVLENAAGRLSTNPNP